MNKIVKRNKHKPKLTEKVTEQRNTTPTKTSKQTKPKKPKPKQTPTEQIRTPGERGKMEFLFFLTVSLPEKKKTISKDLCKSEKQTNKQIKPPQQHKYNPLKTPKP